MMAPYAEELGVGCFDIELMLENKREKSLIVDEAKGVFLM